MEFLFTLNLIDGEITVVIDNRITCVVYKEEDTIDFSELEAINNDIIETKVRLIVRQLFSLENEI